MIVDRLRAHCYRLGSVEPWSDETGFGQVIWRLGEACLVATESRRDGVGAAF
ncbi:MAG: hypothetical protein ACOVN4_05135 [Bosea sp. (in: a-proteobacteria)]